MDIGKLKELKGVVEKGEWEESQRALMSYHGALRDAAPQLIQAAETLEKVRGWADALDDNTLWQGAIYHVKAILDASGEPDTE